MNILITGGDGFIAKNVYNFMKDRYKVFSTNRQTLNVLDENRVASFLQKNNIDIVVHTAVSGCGRKTDTYKDFCNNINMFNNLYNNRDKFKIMINFGSGAEFDRSRNIKKKSECEIFDSYPSDYYGLAKNIITREIIKTNNIYNFRVFGCFGENEKNGRFVKHSLSRLKKGEPILIHQNRYIDFVYVKDLCLVIDYYVQNFDKKQLHKDINICYNNEITLLDIAKKILSIKQLPQDVIVEDLKVGNHYSGDGTRLKQTNIQLYGLEKGLGEIINV